MQSIFDNDKFICSVQSFPQLWDKNDPDYIDKFKKESAWKMVMNVMFGEEEIEKLDMDQQNEIAKDVRKKWRSLRSSFARELSKRKNCKSGSERSWKTYTYFDQLTFLTPSMAHVEVESSLSPLENDEPTIDVAAEMGLNDTPVTPPRTMLRKRKSSRNDSESDLAAVLAKSLKWRQEKEEVLGNDPDRLFLLSLLEDFKKVPCSRKSDVKVTFIKAISNALYPQHLPPPPQHSCYASHMPYDIQNSVYHPTSSQPPDVDFKNPRCDISPPSTSCPLSDIVSQCSPASSDKDKVPSDYHNIKIEEEEIKLENKIEELDFQPKKKVKCDRHLKKLQIIRGHDKKVRPMSAIKIETKNRNAKQISRSERSINDQIYLHGYSSDEDEDILAFGSNQNDDVTNQ